ncbi:MAG: hypothetical protein RI947_616 [Candidatus Parcubacteria bacterium]
MVGVKVIFTTVGDTRIVISASSEASSGSSDGVTSVDSPATRPSCGVGVPPLASVEVGSPLNAKKAVRRIRITPVMTENKGVLGCEITLRSICLIRLM